MELEQATTILDAALAKMPSLRESTCGSVEHVEFVQTTGLELARIFGRDAAPTRNFARINFQATGNFVSSLFDIDRDLARRRHDAYLRGLNYAEGIIRSAKSQLATHGADKILTTSRIEAGAARVFISHGKRSEALVKVERFVRALGLEPVIVVHGASEGMSVDALVEKRMAECDCAIILATGDDQVGNIRQPRPNVIHEIGLAQEKLDDKIVYLKEAGCEFPSNIRPKVWESFTQDNLEAAFEKIIKELRAFRVI